MHASIVTMNSTRKNHHDVFEPTVLVNVQDKRCLNLRMMDKINYLLRELKTRNTSCIYTGTV